MYRINFNGQQIHGPFKTYAEAKREILAIGCIGSETWIQRYEGEGEWSAAGLTPAQRRPHLHR